MKPEHSKTKTKAKSEIKDLLEADTKNYETETETSLVNSIACESKTCRYTFWSITRLR